MTTTQLSVEHMPAVESALECAVPVMFEHADFPGIGGTCFAVRYAGRVVFLTASHCVKEAQPKDLGIPISFNRRMETWPISQIGRPAILTGSEYGTGLDVAILVPAIEPSFEIGQASPLDLKIFANMDNVPPSALFAVRGYLTGEGIDYASGEIKRDSLALLATYDGWLDGFPGCHTLRLATPQFGGVDGLSGSPVMRITRAADGSWSPGLAGMVVMGGPSKIHIVDVRTLIGVLSAPIPNPKKPTECNSEGGASNPG